MIRIGTGLFGKRNYNEGGLLCQVCMNKLKYFIGIDDLDYEDEDEEYEEERIRRITC